jgi:hypothetical protein
VAWTSITSESSPAYPALTASTFTLYHRPSVAVKEPNKFVDFNEVELTWVKAPPLPPSLVV